jgi:uncharacterized membrane protein (DUF373 family)
MKDVGKGKFDLFDSLNLFEKFVYGVLMLLLAIVVVMSVIELARQLWNYMSDLTPMFLEQGELLHLLGMFLLVLIAVELLDTMKAYFRENAIHVEVVLLLAIIAIARKVILLEPSTAQGIEMIGIGIIIVGLAAGYFLIKRSGFTIRIGEPKQPPSE